MEVKWIVISVIRWVVLSLVFAGIFGGGDIYNWKDFAKGALAATAVLVCLSTGCLAC